MYSRPVAKARPRDPAELAERESLNEYADDLLEECLRDRLSLKQTFDHFLPKIATRLGASAIVVVTRNEELREEPFHFGDVDVDALYEILHRSSEGTSLGGDGRTLIVSDLDVAGTVVGRICFAFEGDRTPDADKLEARIDVVCEELDGILATIQTAARKQEIILKLTDALSNRVFETGIDRAAEILTREAGARLFAIAWTDELHPGVVSYRIYREGRRTYDSEEEAHRHPAIEAELKVHGTDFVSPDIHIFRAALGWTRSAEAGLISGLTRGEVLGKILVSGGEHGLSAMAHDLVSILGGLVSQRLVDHNRERRHLAQFFSPDVIGELLRDPDYLRHLQPRVEPVGVLFADINSFTKITEQVLDGPSEVAHFVDVWSNAVVEELWKHGGVFDKLVGDCIIGLFGPPFFRTSAAERAAAALDAAQAVLRRTIEIEKELPSERLKAAGVPGLGVAIGVNLCSLCCGLMGPNQDFTGFSPGMNNTARLQGLAGFREVLVMEEAAQAALTTPDAGRWKLGEAQEAAVKNVRLPLKYRKVTFPDA